MRDTFNSPRVLKHFFLQSCFDSLIQSPGEELEEESLQDITICACNFIDAVRWWSHLQIKNLMPGSSSANVDEPRKQASDHILAWLSGNYSGLIYHPASPFLCTYLVCSSVLPCILASRVWLIFQLSGQAYSSNLWPQDPVSTTYYTLVTGIGNYMAILKKDNINTNLAAYLSANPSYLETSLCPALLLAKV